MNDTLWFLLRGHIPWLSAYRCPACVIRDALYYLGVRTGPSDKKS